MQRIAFSHILSCVLVLFIFSFPCLVEQPLPFLSELELKSIDLRFKVRGGRKPSGQIIIAGIEAKGIETYGRWPWPRSVFAKLIVRLKESGVKTIVFDLLFPEPEEDRIKAVISSLSKSYTDLGLSKGDFHSQIFLDEMDQIIKESDNDRLMAEAIAWGNNVILGVAFEPGRSQEALTKEFIARSCFPVSSSALSQGYFPNQEKILIPIDPLRSQAQGFGYVNIFPDKDGIIRRVTPLIIRHGKAHMPLAVAAAGHYTGDVPQLSSQGNIQMGNYVFPLPTEGSLLLNFYGLENSFKGYSISDIIEGQIPAAQLKDKMVIIGGMATGIGDIWPTPLSGEIPGVYIQATFAENILQNRLLRIPKPYQTIRFFSIFAMVLLLLVVAASLPPLMASLFGCIILALYAVMGQYLFETQLLVFPMVLPLAAGGTTLLVLLVLNFISEGKQHRWIKKSFSQYLSPEVIEILVKEPDQLKLGGEEKELTVMLADIRNFTSLSEGLSPSDLTRLLNLYLGELTDVILDNGGTLDKYMGDAIMAFFGAPVHDADNPIKACQTAILMCEHLHDKRLEWASQGLPALKIGVGLNTGPMIVGNLGSTRRFDYSVIGDHVNLASRLEGLSKVYGVKIIISEYTRNRLESSDIVCRELDIVRVKGKAEPVRIYELMGKDYFTDNTYAFVEQFEKGLHCYRRQDFPQAIQAFEKTLVLKPMDKPSRFFIQRCHSLDKKSLGPDWDGIWAFTQK
jgi:adenylate cyclase